MNETRFGFKSPAVDHSEYESVPHHQPLSAAVTASPTFSRIPSRARWSTKVFPTAAS
jgi:hypothetical protein